MLIGAAVGAVGSFINTGLSIWRESNQAKQDDKKRSDEYEMAKLNVSRDTQVASYKHDTDGGQASQWVINLLRLVRPSITFYALALVTLFWFTANDIDRSIIITAVLDLASMAVAWWFGDRVAGRK